MLTVTRISLVSNVLKSWLVLCSLQPLWVVFRHCSVEMYSKCLGDIVCGWIRNAVAIGDVWDIRSCYCGPFARM